MAESVCVKFIMKKFLVIPLNYFYLDMEEEGGSIEEDGDPPTKGDLGDVNKKVCANLSINSI